MNHKTDSSPEITPPPVHIPIKNRQRIRPTPSRNPEPRNLEIVYIGPCRGLLTPEYRMFLNP